MNMFKSNDYSSEIKCKLFFLKNSFKSIGSNSSFSKGSRVTLFQNTNTIPFLNNNNFNSVLSFLFSIHVFILHKLISAIRSKLKSNNVYKYTAVIFHAAVFIRCVKTIRKRKTTFLF